MILTDCLGLITAMVGRKIAEAEGIERHWGRDALAEVVGITIRHVSGHVGAVGSEGVDGAAKAAAGFPATDEAGPSLLHSAAGSGLKLVAREQRREDLRREANPLRPGAKRYAAVRALQDGFCWQGILEDDHDPRREGQTPLPDRSCTLPARRGTPPKARPRPTRRPRNLRCCPRDCPRLQQPLRALPSLLQPVCGRAGGVVGGTAGGRKCARAEGEGRRAKEDGDLITIGTALNDCPAVLNYIAATLLGPGLPAESGADDGRGSGGAGGSGPLGAGEEQGAARPVGDVEGVVKGENAETPVEVD